MRSRRVHYTRLSLSPLLCSHTTHAQLWLSVRIAVVMTVTLTLVRKSSCLFSRLLFRQCAQSLLCCAALLRLLFFLFVFFCLLAALYFLSLPS